MVISTYKDIENSNSCARNTKLQGQVITKKYECLDSCDYRKSYEIILGTYVKQSFASTQKAASRMIQRTLPEKFPNLKCVFIWLEPYHNGYLTGGWHAHLILRF